MKIPRGFKHFISSLLFCAVAGGQTAWADTAARRSDDVMTPAVPSRVQVVLPKAARSTEAIGLLKSSGLMPQWANGYGMTEAEAVAMFKKDPTVYVDKKASLMFIDVKRPKNATGNVAASSGINSATIPLNQTFLLHSKSGSPRKLYLDFNGHVTTNTDWNASYGLSTITSPPFSLDNIPNTFSDTELTVIQNIWKRVAEDFSAFDIDVTTEEPPVDQMTRTSASDTTFGVRMVITNDFTASTNDPCQCGGFAYVGVFAATNEANKPGFVFANNLGFDEKNIAEATTHEAGHTMGLNHDGTNTLAYYEGQGTGITGWAPIMGVGYSKNLVQWSKGEYSRPNNTEDDYLVMQKNGVVFAADDHGNSISTATVLPPTVSNGLNSFTAAGVIQGPLDIDFFKFDAAAGTVTINVTPALTSPNLDTLISLKNASGVELAVSNPIEALTSNITVTLPSTGSYYLSVKGTGKGSPLTTGYSAYGSIGTYSVSITAPIPGNATAPVAAITPTSSSGVAPHSVTFRATGSTGSSALTYMWDFGDGTTATGATPAAKVYSATGVFKASVTVKDAAGLTNSAQSVVTVTAPPSARFVFADTYRIAGLLVRQGSPDGYARVTVTVKGSNGAVVPNATVSGNWSGIVTGKVSGVTNASGQVSLNSPVTPNVGTFTFTMGNITASTFTYDANKNKSQGISINF